jgi:hypothetical protein
MIAGMARQLVLMEPQAADWRLDERTKQLGRQGLVEARRALQQAIKRAAS